MDIWFEAVPSPAGSGAKRIDADVQALQRVRSAGASRILVPEVVDTGHAAIDSLPFAAKVRDDVGLPTGIAIVTSTRDGPGIRRRIQEADAADVDTLLLVGPPSRDQARGPSVTEALAAHAEDRHIGVVTIPTRRRDDLDEPDRILAKQEAGARFAVSQILFDAEHALDLRRSYVAKSDDPIPFYYSLAPVKRLGDLEFLRALGVLIPDDVEAQIRAAPANRRAQTAQSIILDVARRLVTAHAAEGLGPVGFCISHVLFRNVPEAVDLVEALQAPMATH